MPSEMFNMLRDPLETTNLLLNIPKQIYSIMAKSSVDSKFANYGNNGVLLVENRKDLLRQYVQYTNKGQKGTTVISSISKDDFLADRNSSLVHYSLLISLYKVLFDFARHGNEAHQLYLKKNLGRVYAPTPLSDNRPIRPNHVLKKFSQQALKKLREDFLREGFCSSDCSCDLVVQRVATLPYHEIPESRKYLCPKSFLNASVFLHL